MFADGHKAADRFDFDRPPLSGITTFATSGDASFSPSPAAPSDNKIVKSEKAYFKLPGWCEVRKGCNFLVVNVFTKEEGRGSNA